MQQGAIHLNSMKLFCDVARHRSFSQAAQASSLTQSAVSQAIAHLEKRLCVQLIDRSTRPLRLTPVGHRYYEGCQAILAQYEELEAGIRNTGDEIAGTVQVAAIYSVGLSDMSQYGERLTCDLPRAQVHIDYLHPDRVQQRVLDGTADLGLVSFPGRAPKLTALPWRDEPMVLACSEKHPFAHRLAVPIGELDGQTYVHFAEGLVIRRKVDQFLPKHGVDVKVALEFDNVENIKQAVVIGAGVALLPAPTLRREVEARSIAALPLHGARMTRPLAIIHRKRPPLSVAARRFVDILLDGVNGSANRAPEQRS
jgi:DNA-binding transcriptional LysR family regulator